MAVASALCLDVPALVAKSGVVDYLRRCQVSLQLLMLSVLMLSCLLACLVVGWWTTCITAR
jgi:hypothetical protein